jgi:hypothetical protein
MGCDFGIIIPHSSSSQFSTFLHGLGMMVRMDDHVARP